MCSYILFFKIELINGHFLFTINNLLIQLLEYNHRILLFCGIITNEYIFNIYSLVITI